MAKSDRIESITLDSYLSNYSTNRRIDGVIKKWFNSKNGNKYCIKTIKEWENELKSFFSQVEKKI